eukprot:349824-Chlamydomonas_euryale.AAC.18
MRSHRSSARFKQNQGPRPKSSPELPLPPLGPQPPLPEPPRPPPPRSPLPSSPSPPPLPLRPRVLQRERDAGKYTAARQTVEGPSRREGPRSRRSGEIRLCSPAPLLNGAADEQQAAFI